jgi:hypothetical protein
MCLISVERLNLSRLRQESIFYGLLRKSVKRRWEPSGSNGMAIEKWLLAYDSHTSGNITD